MSVLRDIAARATKLRVALYSHDTMGLGHMRRNILLAHAFARPPLSAVVLLLAGARRATAFALPRGVDCLTLPSLKKEPDARYRSRRLDLELEELIALRAATIRAAVSSFDPDLLVVDNVPRGAVRELDPTLEALSESGRTRCVLGLRDVLDDQAAVKRDWTRAGNEEAIRRFYQSVWVYGDRAVFDLSREYGFPPDVATKIRFTGYLDQRVRLEFSKEDRAESRIHLPSGPLAICLLGGGQDGDQLAEAFAHAELPPRFHGLIVTGPFADEELMGRLRRIEDSNPRLTVVEFVREPMRLLQRAERIVSMGGYNTTCEALSLGKRSLIVPRVRPRVEQWIRAKTFQRLGLVDVLHPDDVTPEALSRWLASDGRPETDAPAKIDLNGLSRIPGLVEEALAAPDATTGRARRTERGARSLAY